MNAKGLDWIIMPTVGMTHPVIASASRSAEFAITSFNSFKSQYPESKLKVIFVIFNDEIAEEKYKAQAVFSTFAPAYAVNAGSVVQVEATNTQEKPIYVGRVYV